ncbi:cannabinoid receptor 2-like [Scleropages formosus]|uniref:Cannabinoid receptor 2-like n=1 Tax=Scleropages formosus TaxID=113540 RepID=A0A0N8JZ87_SCLFO|nr:cannabinoid receptor 2-like [Scleropages formosus]
MAEQDQSYPTEPTGPHCNSSCLPPPRHNQCDLFNCSQLECYMVLSDMEKKAISSICYLAGPVTFLENMLVLLLIGITPALRRRPSYLFIGSLALADVFASCFFTISFLDFHLYQRHDQQIAYLFKLGGVTLAFSGSVGSLLLTAMDRYICIHRASEYKAVLTRRRALGCLTALWATVFLVSFLPLMGWTCQTELTPPCSRLFPYVNHLYMTCWTILILVLLAIILGAYALILWKAHRHEASMATHMTGPSGQARMRMDIRVARMLGLILLILVGCWLPVLSLMLADVSFCLTHAHQRAFAFCSTLCLVNSAVNPLLYALRCRELRGALAHAFQRFLCSRCHYRASSEDTGYCGYSDDLTLEGEAGTFVHTIVNSLSKRVDKQQLELVRK